MNIRIFLMSHQINGIGYYSKISIYSTPFLNLLMKPVGKHRLTSKEKVMLHCQWSSDRGRI